jgi:hypothetical protein
MQYVTPSVVTSRRFVVLAHLLDTDYLVLSDEPSCPLKHPHEVQHTIRASVSESSRAYPLLETSPECLIDLPNHSLRPILTPPLLIFAPHPLNTDYHAPSDEPSCLWVLSQSGTNIHR